MGKRYKSEKSFKFLEDGFHGGQKKKKASKHSRSLSRQQRYLSDESDSLVDLSSIVPSRLIQKIV